MRIAPLPVVTLNQWPVTHRLVHLAISAQVLDASCSPVLAVTTPLQCGLVDMIQLVIHAVMADFPMPCPELIALRTGLTGFVPSKPFSLTCRPMSSRYSQAHWSGPYLQLNRLAHGSTSSTT